MVVFCSIPGGIKKKIVISSGSFEEPNNATEMNQLRHVISASIGSGTRRSYPPWIE